MSQANQDADPQLMQTTFEAQRATALAWRQSTAAERIERLERLVPLAPLHLPHNLAPVRSVMAQWNDRGGRRSGKGPMSLVS